LLATILSALINRTIADIGKHHATKFVVSPCTGKPR